MRLISTALGHQISGGIGFATNIVLAIAIGYLAKFVPIINPQNGIQFFWSSQEAKTQSINEAAGVGVVVFMSLSLSSSAVCYWLRLKAISDLERFGLTRRMCPSTL
jgi:hypothetical protein